MKMRQFFSKISEHSAKVCGCVAILCLEWGCAYNDVPESTPDDPVIPNATLRISTLRSFYRGKPVNISGENIVVRGFVTTSDRTNNFYRVFVIEDATGAVEIHAGLYDLHNQYRLGQQVAVRANGLTLGMSDGLLQLGLRSYTPALYEVEYVDYRPLLDRHVFRGEIFQTGDPATVVLSELNDGMIGRLVRIGGLRIDYPRDTIWAVPASLSPTGQPLSANLLFRQSIIDSIYLYTSGYADFAGEMVPRAKVDITGILLKGKVNGKLCYQLKIRDKDDVQNFQ